MLYFILCERVLAAMKCQVSRTEKSMNILNVTQALSHSVIAGMHLPTHCEVANHIVI